MLSRTSDASGAEPGHRPEAAAGPDQDGKEQDGPDQDGPDQDGKDPEEDGREPGLRETACDGLKIAVVGGFGAGKTTLVGAVSEIRPLSTEETLSGAGVGVDDPAGVERKSHTTVAFDFGRITLDDERVLYLFGAPGQERFWYLWDRLFSGTLGAVVLVDTRRIADCWYAVDRLEHLGVPFVVARNNFVPPQHSLEELREALALSPGVPVIDCDARTRQSAKQVLVTLTRHVLDRAGARQGMGGAWDEHATGAGGAAIGSGAATR